MRPLALRPTLVEQTYEAILNGICDGTVPLNTQLVQEQLAQRLGVSRQPIQQALMLLRNDGILEDVGRRGVIVPPLDPVTIRHRYQIRAALDALAARLAAQRCAASPTTAAQVRREGAAIIAKGSAAARDGAVCPMIAHDVAFHSFLYRASGNTALAPTAAVHWPFLRRAMGEGLRRSALALPVWEQHQQILDALVDGDAAAAVERATYHLEATADFLAADIEASQVLAAAG